MGSEKSSEAAPQITQESLFIPWPKPESGGRLHFRHIFREPSAAGAAANAGAHAAGGPPVLMVHGAIENARIFYSESGKGLGPFFARNGFDVYAADLFGRGKSEPRISRRSKHGQFESILEEIPAFVERIRLRRGSQTRQLWMGHSWGGVLLLCVLARYPEYRELVRGLVFFGTKRSVRARNREVFLKLDLFWNRGAKALVGLHGYLPALGYRIGSDNETRLSHSESSHWVRSGSWVDPRDGFDYGAALRAAALPPLLFFAGEGDRSLGHPHDVRRLIAELGPRSSGVEFRLLSRAGGNRLDYGHIDMLTSPAAETDHFQQALEWAKARGI